MFYYSSSSKIQNMKTQFEKNDFSGREDMNKKNVHVHVQGKHNQFKSYLKPRSHSAGMAPVHPGGGQQVYRDEPGHFS